MCSSDLNADDKFGVDIIRIHRASLCTAKGPGMCAATHNARQQGGRTAQRNSVTAGCCTGCPMAMLSAHEAEKAIQLQPVDQTGEANGHQCVPTRACQRPLGNRRNARKPRGRR